MSDQPAETARPITIPRPQIFTGPQHMTVDEATVRYLREAAARVREQRYWGSGVTALVSDLLDAVAVAIEKPPVIDWTQMHHGTCPKCGEHKFIGHGPLCPECFGTGTPPGATS